MGIFIEKWIRRFIDKWVRCIGKLIKKNIPTATTGGPTITLPPTPSTPTTSFIYTRRNSFKNLALEPPRTAHQSEPKRSRWRQPPRLPSCNSCNCMINCKARNSEAPSNGLLATRYNSYRQLRMPLQELNSCKRIIRDCRVSLAQQRRRCREAQRSKGGGARRSCKRLLWMRVNADYQSAPPCALWVRYWRRYQYNPFGNAFAR